MDNHYNIYIFICKPYFTLKIFIVYVKVNL